MADGDVWAQAFADQRYRAETCTYCDGPILAPRRRTYCSRECVRGARRDKRAVDREMKLALIGPKY